MLHILLTLIGGLQAAPRPGPGPVPAPEPAPEPVEPLLPSSPSVKPSPEALDRMRLHVQNMWNDLVVQFTSPIGLYQLAIIIAALLVALVGGRLLTKFVEARWAQPVNPHLKRLRAGLVSLIWPVIWAILLGAATAGFAFLALPNDFIRIVSNLLYAWIAIRLLSSVVMDAGLARFISGILWLLAALAITNLLAPAESALRAMRFDGLGLGSISALSLIQGITLIIVLFWLALFTSRLIQGQVSRSAHLPPSVRVLTSQVIRFALIALAIVIALNIAGINLTALTVLSGAIGVGVGFGLRSIFENFISGIILIFEKTLKVGDFVELEDGTCGTVREVNARSTIITTNDNIDILVPNSQFVTGRVTNWTLRDTSRRLRIPFGVAYGSDKDVVKAAGLEAASHVRHTLKSVPGREPDVWLVGFGDSALDFELVVWITDFSVSRPARVKADYYWALETALGRHGVAIPFPQLDLHLVPPGPPKDTGKPAADPSPSASAQPVRKSDDT